MVRQATMIPSRGGVYTIGAQYKQSLRAGERQFGRYLITITIILICALI